MSIDETLQRVRGKAEVGVRLDGARSVLDTLYQSGSAKVLLPKAYGPVPEAVLLNTAGGVTGGDRLSYGARVSSGAALTVTTQAAERIYKSAGGEGEIDTVLTVGAGGRIDWLPQETILFDGGRLRRRLTIDMDADATVLALEPLVLGRAAMGEIVRNGFVSDHWRIKRGGRLVYADALRLEPPIDQQIAGAAAWGGNTAAAVLIYAANDAEARLEEARSALHDCGPVQAAASAWRGLLAVRFLAPASAPLRRTLIAFLTVFRQSNLPRVWNL